MEKVETFDGNEKLILERGEGFTPTQRIEYYKNVIKILYVERGAFKRDMYMEDNGLKKRLEKEIEKLEEEVQGVEDERSIVKIAGKYGLVDITRIFEAMKEAGIISTKTEVSQIVGIFFNEKLEQKYNIAKYNATINNTLKKYRTSNSSELLDFIKIIVNKSFTGKEKELEELEEYISKLQK